MADLNDLDKRIAVLEERMNTSYERLRADIADQGKEAAQREKRLVLTLTGTVIAAVGLGVAFLGFLIGLPQ